MKVYLAGPDVFFPNAEARGEGLKRACAEHGLEGVFPLDAGLQLDSLSKHDAAQAIYAANIKLIKSCDAVLANMTPFRGVNMDTGTAFEMGYGAAQGKLVVGYSEDSALYVARVKSSFAVHEDGPGVLRDGDDLLVEDFDLADNLMMCGAAEFIAPSLQEGLRYLQSKAQA